jgi:hypothetical protein
MIKVNSDAKITTISQISSSSSEASSSATTHEIDSSTESSCLSNGKRVSTYNLNQSNLRYEKAPMKCYQQHDSTLSISPITTATTVTNNTTNSNVVSIISLVF